MPLAWGTAAAQDILTWASRISLGLAWLLFFLGLFAVIRWLWRRWHESRPSVHAGPPDPSWNSRPRPGQIWWADVPFSDGSGSKVRPCLVIRTHERAIEVLKITSQDKSGRRDCVPIPTKGWDRRSRKNSWLDLGQTYLLVDDAVGKIAGSCDAMTWSAVTRRHRTGWVYV
jgi:hypothetical protein